MEKWKPRLSRFAKKQYIKLEKSGKTRPSIVELVDLLMLDLEKNGPERTNWPNYGKLSTKNYHCHLKKGRPTYVACWEIINSDLKQIEVYYVGTHEGAPY